MTIQIIATIFVTFALTRVILRIIRDKASIINLFFWGGFWTLVLIVVWLPDYVGQLSGIFGVGRGIDVLVYLSILGLYYSVYRIYALIQKQTKDITILTREIAKMQAYKTTREKKK